MTCLHGDGAKVVLRHPWRSLDEGQEVEADIFTGIPGMARQTIRLIAEANRFRVPERQTFERAPGVPVEYYSGYQRLADPEEDTRDTALQALAGAFVTAPPPEQTGQLPAIYTYFGQFIAHEVSRLDLAPDGKICNLNTSSFDLDTVFLPAGKFQAVIADQAPAVESFGGAALGNTALAVNPNLRDLPRARDGRPLVPDCRNDANPALAQLHVAILRTYRSLLTAHDAAAARTRLRTLLHAIVVRDYLKEIVAGDVYEDVLANGRRLVNPQQSSPAYFQTPIEFAAGAFRFGHAMVRDTYRWRFALSGREAELSELMNHTHAGDGLYQDGAKKIRRLAEDWTMADADMLHGSGGAGPNLASPVVPALGYEMCHLASKHVPGSDATVNLAAKTLSRGQEVRLASAQSLWALIQSGVSGRFLSAAEITGPPGSPFHAALTLKEFGKPTLAERTPLWFYTLREAQVLHGGRRLGPLGGRIVMETIHAAISAAGSDPGALPLHTIPELFASNFP